jgi:hypothetical protein
MHPPITKGTTVENIAPLAKTLGEMKFYVFTKSFSLDRKQILIPVEELIK